ncbi:uncharacterized protein LOC112184387 isoform X2 [Rosa chinensis]|uniref:uncharacterized protein LOC112184387 isoform X2 n=1 Tax=Rosa chinensis TaxID=74649 RepID=UPI001AD90BF5|nr:uncharacterized protein LOC112184387 isoform X2 [Rosa chinensis]
MNINIHTVKHHIKEVDKDPLLHMKIQVSHATIIVAAIDLYVVRNRSARCEEKEKLESVNQGKFGYSKKEDMELPLFLICLLIFEEKERLKVVIEQITSCNFLAIVFSSG